MKKVKFFLIALVVTLLVISQFAMVSAAPPLDEADFIAGRLDRVTLTTDPNTGVTTVEVILADESGNSHTVVVSEQTASELGLLSYDEDGNPQLVEILPPSLEIPLSAILPANEPAHHPVGSALAAYFSEIPGVDYEVLMAAHEDGYGFGVIAQALWLTQKMEGDADIMVSILEAKKTGDYSAFTLEDGTVLTNWGQFRKAVMGQDKKNNLGVVMSGKEKEKEKGNFGNNGNHNGNGNNNGNGNANGQDKNKDKNNNGNNGNNGNKTNNGKNKP